MIRVEALLLSAALCVAALAACRQAPPQEAPAGFEWPQATAPSVSTYARIVEASYADTLAQAQALDGSLKALVAAPSQEAMDKARIAWLASREPYLQTEVFRFYDGPIDNTVDGPEGMLNGWPLDENYIDYVKGAPEAGIINGAEALDGPRLESLNERGGEKNIATGYHALEFLLWGQDLSDDGPGERPFTDYVTDGSGTAAHQDRRGQYLLILGQLLVDHLARVHGAWAPAAASRVAFEADSKGAFKKILTGMIVLSGFETGGERLQAALDSGDREDEHSCFSDNTHRDMIMDIQGILNVWTGRYARVDGSVVEGVGIREVVAAVKPDLASRLDARIATSLSLAKALKPPFEKEIVPGSEGQARVQALILSLKAQEKLLFEVFAAFELTVTLPE